MAGTDARPQGLRRWMRTTGLSLIFGALLVGAVVWAAYRWGGPSSASAQRPSAPTQAAPTGTPQRRGATAPTSPPAGQRKISIMAVVNGQTITRQQLAQECLRRYGEEVLESMVNKQLILDACRRQGVTITQQDIDEEIRRLAGKFGLSVDRWLLLLKEERHITPEQYSRDIVWPTLALRRLAAGQIQVTPEEISRVLASEFGPRVQVRLIAVSRKEDADRIRAMAVADPATFPKLARDWSEDTNSRAVGGLILPIRKNMGEPKVEQAAFALREGEISPVIHVANQYLILKCEKHIPPVVVSPAQRRAAEAEAAERLREKKLRDVASRLFKELQDQAHVQNVYNNPQLHQQMPGVAATINGVPITLAQLAEECIVRHGREVLDGEINRLLITQALQRQRQTVQQADIDREIARAADAYGYLKPDGSPDVERWLDHVVEQDGATVDLYIRDAVWPSVALKKLVGDRIQVTEEDLQRGFEANYGPRVEVLAIVLNNQRQANQVWNMAKNNPTEKFFGELANQYSVEPVSRANFGRVPPIQRYGGRPTLEKAAFELQPGEISGLIAVGDKWVILYCLGRTKQVVQQMDETIRQELFKDIHEKKLRLEMAKLFDQLKEEAQIDNFLAGTSQSGHRGVASAAGDQLRSRVPFALPPAVAGPPLPDAGPTRH